MKATQLEAENGLFLEVTGDINIVEVKGGTMNKIPLNRTFVLKSLIKALETDLKKSK
jgi:hypothetical protein